MDTLTARVITERRRLDELIPAWTALLERDSGGTIFSTPEWQLTWLDTMPAVSPRCVVVHDQTGRLRAVLPMAACARRVGPLVLRALELGGEAVVCGDHLGLVSAPSDRTAAWAAAAAVIESNAADVDLVRLASIDPQEAGAAATLGGSRRWRPLVMPDDVAPRMQLPRDGTDVLDHFSASRRKRLRYYERHFAESHSSAAIALNEERMPLDAALDALSASHASRWQARGEAGAIADRSFAAFLRRFARVSLERGWLRLYQTIVDDRVVATLFVLHWGDTASAWLLGWDPAFGKWNVSELLWVHSMREAAREGLRTFDFLRGRDPYKFRFPVESPELRTLQWSVTVRGRLAAEAERVNGNVAASARRWRTRVARVAKKLRRERD